MHGIFAYIWWIFMIHVGIDIPYMDPMDDVTAFLNE